MLDLLDIVVKRVLVSLGLFKVAGLLEHVVVLPCQFILFRVELVEFFLFFLSF